jgi:hypothetical protein
MVESSAKWIVLKIKIRYVRYYEHCSIMRAHVAMADAS